MTDYFALLGQPRRPWIELETLEEKYHELARRTHPDQSAHSPNEFAQLNEAYRTLRDPKLRLEHLLRLEGQTPEGTATDVPTDMADLFMRLAPVLRGNDKAELDAAEKELAHTCARAMNALRELDKQWHTNPALATLEIEKLYRRFAFLGRWQSHLDERRFSF